MSTGFGGAERGGIAIGDSVAVFAQGPIGLCATAGAKLKGATRIIVVDGLPERLEMARRIGADFTIDFTKTDPIAEIMRLTEGHGVDVAIEALGTQHTFESCLRVLKAGGVLSSLGVYSGKLSLPLDAIAAGLGDHKIVTTLCPGSKERMRRLMNVVAAGRVDLEPLPSRIATRSIRSSKPMSCSPISATACSRWRSRLERGLRVVPQVREGIVVSY